MSDKWHHINQTTTDEDEQADYGKDVMFLDSRHERIERLAVEAFGPQIKNFRVNRLPSLAPYRTENRDRVKQPPPCVPQRLGFGIASRRCQKARFTVL